MTSKLFWYPANDAHRKKILTAIGGSSIGGCPENLPGDSVFVVVRGMAPPDADLSCGRPQGSVSIDAIARWIAQFLDANAEGLVLIEDVIHSPSDPAVLKRNRPGWWLPYGVAWPVFANESVEEAEQVLTILRGGPLFYGFYQLPSNWSRPKDGTKLSDADLVLLRSSLVAALVDVYDWDGLILWKRVHHSFILPDP